MIGGMHEVLQQYSSEYGIVSGDQAPVIGLTEEVVISEAKRKRDECNVKMVCQDGGSCFACSRLQPQASHPRYFLPLGY